jgi:hypothetical protein
MDEPEKFLFSLLVVLCAALVYGASMAAISLWSY